MSSQRWRYVMIDMVLRWLYLIISSYLLIMRPSWISFFATVIGGIGVLWYSSKSNSMLLR